MLKRFQVGDDVADLAWVEAEFGHGRVPGDDAFSEGFFKVFDRITRMQRAERRRDFQWALADMVDGVTAGAIGEQKNVAPLRRGREGLITHR